MLLPLTANSIIYISQFLSIFVIVGFLTIAVEQGLDLLVKAKDA